MVKSQLLDGSASGIGNRKAQSQNAVTRHAPVPDRPIKSVVDAALIVEKSRSSLVNRLFFETKSDALKSMISQS